MRIRRLAILVAGLRIVLTVPKGGLTIGSNPNDGAGGVIVSGWFEPAENAPAHRDAVSRLVASPIPTPRRIAGCMTQSEPAITNTGRIIRRPRSRTAGNRKY